MSLYLTELVTNNSGKTLIDTVKDKLDFILIHYESVCSQLDKTHAFNLIT